MSITYTPSTNFGAKDALPINDPNKVIYGAEFTTEFNAITTAFGEAAPTASPTFTGTATFGVVNAASVSTAAFSCTTSATFTPAITVQGQTVDSASIISWNSTALEVGTSKPNWDTAYNDKINSAAFDTATGVLTLTQQDAGTVTVDLDGRYSTTDTDTTYTGGTNITLNGTTFDLDASLTGLTDVTTDAVSIGLWEIKLDTNDLRFIYNGTDVLRITTAGAVIALDDVTAFGAP